VVQYRQTTATATSVVTTGRKKIVRKQVGAGRPAPTPATPRQATGHGQRTGEHTNSAVLRSAVQNSRSPSRRRSCRGRRSAGCRDWRSRRCRSRSGSTSSDAATGSAKNAAIAQRRREEAPTAGLTRGRRRRLMTPPRRPPSQPARFARMTSTSASSRASAASGARSPRTAASAYSLIFAATRSHPGSSVERTPLQLFPEGRRAGVGRQGPRRPRRAPRRQVAAQPVEASCCAGAHRYSMNCHSPPCAASDGRGQTGAAGQRDPGPVGIEARQRRRRQSPAARPQALRELTERPRPAPKTRRRTRRESPGRRWRPARRPCAGPGRHETGPVERQRGTETPGSGSPELVVVAQQRRPCCSARITSGCHS